MGEDLPSLREKLLSIPEALIRRESLARTVHKLFSAIYRHQILSNVLVFIIYAVLLIVVASTVKFHKALLPPSGLVNVFYNYVVPLLTLLIALLLYSIPLLLISHSDRMRKALLLQVSRSLDLISQEVIHSCKDTCPVSTDIGDALDTLITKVKQGAASNCILTPNAFYLRADIWRLYLLDHLPTSGPLEVLDVVADKAHRFRDALTSFSGELHMILPDNRDDNVKEFFHDREVTLRLPKDTLVKINQDAIDWIIGELRKTRKRANRATYLHLTNHSPGFRFMLLDDICYLQEFPSVGHGAQQQLHGVQQPIITIERRYEPIAFAAIECGLKIINSLF